MEFVQRHLWWDNSGSYRVLLVLLACMCRAEAQHSDANANECAFNSLGPRLKTLEQTCCTSRHSCARGFPSGRDTCSLACAREFAPFYDKCSNGLARMGLSTPLNSFYTKCLETLYQPGRCGQGCTRANVKCRTKQLQQACCSEHGACAGGSIVPPTCSVECALEVIPFVHEW